MLSRPVLFQSQLVKQRRRHACRAIDIKTLLFSSPAALPRAVRNRYFAARFLSVSGYSTVNHRTKLSPCRRVTLVCFLSRSEIGFRDSSSSGVSNVAAVRDECVLACRNTRVFSLSRSNTVIKAGETTYGCNPRSGPTRRN